MVQASVVVYIDKKLNCPYRFKASGHAGSSKKGANIACAALSMHIRTIVRYFEQLQVIVNQINNTEIDIETLKLNSPQLETAWEIFLLGLTDLSKEYNTIISLKIEEN